MKKFLGIILSMVIMFGNVPVFAGDENIHMKQENCYQTKEQQFYVTTRVSEIIRELKLKERNTYTQVVMVDDWIHDNIKYDTEKVKEHIGSRRTAYSALANGYTVCVGFSQLGMEFCKQLGIPCEYVGCVTRDTNIGHEMLIVEINSLWYYWDITARDKYLLGGEKINKEYKIDVIKSYYDNSEKTVAQKDFVESYTPVYCLTKKDLAESLAFQHMLEDGKKLVDRSITNPALEVIYVSKILYGKTYCFYAYKYTEKGRIKYNLFKENENDKTKLSYVTKVYTYNPVNTIIID